MFSELTTNLLMQGLEGQAMCSQHLVCLEGPLGGKSAEVLHQSSARVPASPSSSELGSHQMAPARESDESGEDGTGDSLSAAYAAGLVGICGFTLCPSLTPDKNNNNNNTPDGWPSCRGWEGLGSQSVRPLWGPTGEVRSQPGSLLGQRDESNDG